MTSNSLTYNEEHHIPSQILDRFGLRASVIFVDSNLCGFLFICTLASSQTLVVHWYTDLYQIGLWLVELIVHIIPLEYICVVTRSYIGWSEYRLGLPNAPLHYGLSLQNKIWNWPDRGTILSKFNHKEGRLAGPTQIWHLFWRLWAHVTSRNSHQGGGGGGGGGGIFGWVSDRQGSTLRVVRSSYPTQVELTTWLSNFKYQYVQGNFCISQGNGSSDNLPENLV